MVIDLSLTGILTLLLIGGIAGGVYYYRDGIANAFGQQKSEEEKDYDFDRKKKEDEEWDQSGWNPDNWGWDNWFPSDNKIDTKQQEKETSQKDIPIVDDTGNISNKNRYNHGNRRFN